MGRIEKIKRQLIEEANRGINTSPSTDMDIYSDYGTNIMSIANKFSGGGYQWGGVSGVCIPLNHNGDIIRNCSEGDKTHCCGFTLSIGFIAATNRGLIYDKTVKQIEKFSSDWYSAGGANGKLCVEALKNLGIGEEVSLEDAIEGDFCQIWRTNGSGHSVIFKSHIKKGDEIIGFNYRSSQKSTGGIGGTKEYFYGSGGSMVRSNTYFGRMNS